MKDSRKSACASIWSTERPGCFAASADTTGAVMECSPPSTKGNFPRVTNSDGNPPDFRDHLLH